MSMGMGMSLELNQKLVLTQRLVVSLPPMNWSLVRAFEEDAQHGFVFPLTIKRRKLEGFDALGHEERMKRIDELNEIFRFAYTRGRDERTGKERNFYKIPLMRDYNVEIDRIKVRISRAEYERATAILENVGRMERIARAIPYHALLTTVRDHLAKEYKVSLDDVVIVGVDRGGRLPAIILSRALNHSGAFFLKVDQGGGQLDVERLEQFVSDGTFRNKHVLFVDSTVDSGRQIEVLRRYFDNMEWQEKLGFRSWSIVGSNEYGQCLYKHLNINWGVNPDETFEDNPLLMGVDYAPGSHIKIVEVPSETSEKIRKVLLDVPDGYVFDLSNIEEQIEVQRKKLEAVEAEQKLYDEVERERSRITTTKSWQNAVTQAPSISFEPLPVTIPNGTPHGLHNILVVGNGQQVDAPQKVAEFIADALGPHYSFFAGTPNGNPGTILKTVLQRVTTPEVRLYQPGYRRGEVNDSYGGVPVVFVEPEKEDMRRQMVKDSHIVLALGGAEGTLREVLLALKFGKPVVLIKGWGAIPGYLLASKKYSKSPHIKACDNVAEAIQTILDITKA
jgi:hypoxanthine phosphoribosyltransferase